MSDKNEKITSEKEFNTPDTVVDSTESKHGAKWFSFLSSCTFRLIVMLCLVSTFDALIFLLFYRISIEYAIALSFTIGIISSVIISFFYTGPLKSITQSIKESDHMQNISIKKTGFREFDELGTLVQILSYSSAGTASKMSAILEATGKPMAIFEIYENTQTAYITKNLFAILEEPDISLYRTGFISSEIFKEKISKLNKYLVPEYTAGYSRFFHMNELSDASKWLKITSIPDEDKIIGLVEDVSEEMLNKTKLEFERDYDVLTSLLNRRAFYSNLQALFSKPEKIKIGAMFSIDLDKLKYVNDTYGHDYGDAYIRDMANILSMTCKKNSIIARLGGDEFAVFMYGYDSQDDIRTEIIRLNIAINNSTFRFPDGELSHLSASGGVSWYPADSTSLQQLIKYSDFAMYSVKKTTRGAFAEFSIEDYKQEAVSLGISAHLEEFMSKKMFEYMFQPIVNAKTGDIFAYEAILKIKHPAIPNVKTLLDLATSQTDMYNLEKLFLTESLIAFENLNAKPTIKLFISSLPDSILDAEDRNVIKRNFCHILNQVIVSIDAEDNWDLDTTKEKLEFLEAWGGSIALCDYGIDNYNEESLNVLKPKYLKIGLSITQSITRDPNRRKLVESLVTSAHQRGISVIADGIEKLEDMLLLVDMGIDYLQGYHICKPVPNPPERLAITSVQLANYSKKKSLAASSEQNEGTDE